VRSPFELKPFEVITFESARSVSRDMKIFLKIDRQKD